ARLVDELVVLGDHLQGVVVADGDALGAALALRRIDDDLEHAADAGILLLAGVVVFLGLRPLLAVHGPIAFGDGVHLGVEFILAEDLAEDGGVGALGDAVHAAGAVGRNIFGNLGRDVA